METFRYRCLVSRRDPDAVAYTRQAIRQADYSSREATSRAELEAPLAVDATEGETSQVELIRMLRSGALVKSDLVFSRGGWTTFADSMEFGELCWELRDSRAFWRTWGPAVRRWALGLAVLGIILLLEFFSHR